MIPSRSGRPAFGFVLEDHTFQQRLDDFLFIGRKLRDSFKLQEQIAIGSTLIRAEDQHICAHLQSDREPSKNKGGPAEKPHEDRPEEKRAKAFRDQVERERKEYRKQQEAERKRQKEKK